MEPGSRLGRRVLSYEPPFQSGSTAPVSSSASIALPPPEPERSSGKDTYTGLSEFMSFYPDCAIFRRFDQGNVENLLYMQAEIIHLQRQLQLVREEQNSRGEYNLTTRSWFDLEQQGSPEAALHLKLVLRRREKLREYSESKHERLADAAGSGNRC
jgi:hypothetical protein